jgi:threonine dehydrogenase-like Zn-dependent dehydrogenase
MKSFAVDANGKLDIVDVPMPTHDDCSALVRIEACGVCNGTDIKLAHGTFKNWHAYPTLLGHEAVGRVVEKGRLVTAFDVGDRVMLPFVDGPSGGFHSSWGGYSEYGTVGDWRAMAKAGRGPGTPGFSEGAYAQTKVPAAIDPVDATMIVTFREVLSAMKRFGMKENRSLVVFGAGPVGLCFTKFAKLLGMGPVVTLDITDQKMADARAMGADLVLNSLEADTTGSVRALLPDGADFVVDAVGINDLINTAMELVTYNGSICCYGISPKLDMQLDWSRAPYNWTLQFVQFPLKIEEMEADSQILYWMESGVLNARDFISDILPFGEIHEAFRMIEERRTNKKTVIRFE